MMEKNCFNCKYYEQPSFEMKEYCWECLRQEELYTGWDRKHITNADHIRSMSDDELAEFIARQRLLKGQRIGKSIVSAHR